MKIGDLKGFIDKLAPFSLAEPWDNCGLLVGDASSTVGKVLVALELTDAVLDEAVSGGFNTILTHHPILFDPVVRIIESDPRGRQLRTLIQYNINVISCHTSLDSAPGGLADIVAEALNLQKIIPLQRISRDWYKFIGFIPPGSLINVSRAVFTAGAGTSGAYSDCAYAVGGEGWFKPNADAKPVLGTVGENERVPEVRWETIVPKNCLEEVISAYLRAHPYEEPAFDIHPLNNKVPNAGLGRVGELSSATAVEVVAHELSQSFGLSEVNLGGKRDGLVQRVAIMPGAGRSFLERAAQVAELFITGDLTYHDADKARELGLGLIIVSHGKLEWAAMSRWADTLCVSLDVPIVLSEAWKPLWEPLRVINDNKSMPPSTSPIPKNSTKVSEIKTKPNREPEKLFEAKSSDEQTNSKLSDKPATLFTDVIPSKLAFAEADDENKTIKLSDIKMAISMKDAAVDNTQSVAVQQKPIPVPPKSEETKLSRTADSRAASVMESAARPSCDSAPKVQKSSGNGFVSVWIDGGSRGNPGPSAIGVVIRDENGESLEEIGRSVGTKTNNVAEYMALIEGLGAAARQGACEVEIVSDSELLVKQMQGEYRVKNDIIKSLYDEAKEKSAWFAKVRFRHVPREENSRADAIVNRVLNSIAKKQSVLEAMPSPIRKKSDIPNLI